MSTITSRNEHEKATSMKQAGISEIIQGFDQPVLRKITWHHTHSPGYLGSHSLSRLPEYNSHRLDLLSSGSHSVTIPPFHRSIPIVAD